MDFNTLSIEEQFLLLEEESLVYYFDEEDESITYACDEQTDSIKESKPVKTPHVTQEVLTDLKEIFKDKFTSPTWKVEPVEVLSVDVGQPEEKPYRGQSHKWKNVKKFSIGVMNLADSKLPNYSKRKYPETVLITDDQKTIVDVILSDASTTAKINTTENPVFRVNKTCIAYFNTGYCRFGFLCRFSHDKVLCQKHEQGQCKKGSKCKFFHRNKEMTSRENKSPSTSVQNKSPVSNVQKQSPVTNVQKQTPPSTSGQKQSPSSTSGQNQARPYYTTHSLLGQKPKPQMNTNFPRSPPSTTKKIFMCKYVLANKPCPFRERCNFSHSRNELEAHIIPCSKGEKCSAVIKQTAVVYRNNQEFQVTKYLNSGPARCPTIHPKEMIANYIHRLTLNY